MDDTHAYHDFRGKLTQASVLPHVVDYVRWQAATQAASEDGSTPIPPDRAPVSINLDLTTACNYRCDHCIDWDILNSGVQHKEAALRDSLVEMSRRGLKSVILIGGGEPTMYPRFADMVRFLKRELHLQVAVVSNGGRNDRILETADCLEPGDWVRLSLDSGSDATFQAMHRPRKPITLDEICEWVPRIKDKNPLAQVGFSYIVTWKGAQRDDTKIVENIHELVMAAERARRYRFDYISVKPFLIRAEENGSEVMDPARAQEEIAVVVARIRAAIAEARQLETESFKVIESTNLRMLENQTWKDHTRQPKRCHMQFFRQVITPHGVFNCPVYRSVPAARIAEADGYRDAAECQGTQQKVGEIIQRFDAAHECREVTCLYNSTNWWLEDLITHPEKIAALEPTPDRGDFYL